MQPANLDLETSIPVLNQKFSMLEGQRSIWHSFFPIRNISEAFGIFLKKWTNGNLWNILKWHAWIPSQHVLL